jgi:hypothetical protein
MEKSKALKPSLSLVPATQPYRAQERQTNKRPVLLITSTVALDHQVEYAALSASPHDDGRIFYAILYYSKKL